MSSADEHPPKRDEQQKSTKSKIKDPIDFFNCMLDGAINEMASSAPESPETIIDQLVRDVTPRAHLRCRALGQKAGLSALIFTTQKDRDFLLTIKEQVALWTSVAAGQACEEMKHEVEGTHVQKFDFAQRVRRARERFLRRFSEALERSYWLTVGLDAVGMVPKSKAEVSGEDGAGEVAER